MVLKTPRLYWRQRHRNRATMPPSCHHHHISTLSNHHSTFRNTSSSGASVMVKWSNDSFSSLEPSSPGAKLTSYSCRRVAVSVRISIMATFLPMQLPGPIRKGGNPTLPLIIPGLLYQRSGMNSSARSYRSSSSECQHDPATRGGSSYLDQQCREA